MPLSLLAPPLTRPAAALLGRPVPSVRGSLAPRGWPKLALLGSVRSSKTPPRHLLAVPCDGATARP